MHLFCTGAASRDQGACILCPCNAPSLRTWRWPASVPLLHHPLTVEGQGGPPLSTGPAALIGPDSKGGGRGDWEGGVGERRGWTRSLLLITDHYPDWMPLIPDLSKLPLLSLLHQPALQQFGFKLRRGLRKETGMNGLSSSHCLVLSFILKKMTAGSPLHTVSHPWRPFGCKGLQMVCCW